MEAFYRWMRRRYELLMDKDQPVGGKWNYDQKNSRVGIMYRTWDRMDSREKKQVLNQAAACRQDLNRL